MSRSSNTLRNVASVDEFLNAAATETVPLFEYLEFEFLLEYDVFAPARRGRTRDHEPPELMRGFLHCYYKDIYGIRPVERELRNTIVWLSCGFDRPPSRDAVDRFLTDLEHVVDEVFDHLVEQAARRGLLNLTYCIDSTDVRAMPADQDASKCYDPTDDEYYYGYGCTIVSTGQKIPIAAEFTESKQAPEETAMRVTRDALAVKQPIWVEDRITEHSEDVQLKQSTLDETYNRRSGVERTNESVKNCGLGRTHARGRVHARAQVFLALCLRLVVAITNYERGDNPGSTIITV